MKSMETVLLAIKDTTLKMESVSFKISPSLSLKIKGASIGTGMEKSVSPALNIGSSIMLESAHL